MRKKSHPLEVISRLSTDMGLVDLSENFGRYIPPSNERKPMGSEISQKWLERVVYDLDTAKAMIQTGRLIYAVFMCQQCLEKCFKALLAYQNKEIVPLHSLRRLTELTETISELDEPLLMKLDFLSRYYISARYKEDLDQLSREITEPVARDFIQFSEELITWLCQKMI
jgi:HEPN domain-containing protein